MKDNKILRVTSFAYHVGDKNYELPKTPDSEYVVDDSSFVPISEAIKQLGNGFGSSSRLEQLYDFNDGKDTGMDIPFNRSADCKDISELSTHISNEQDDVNKRLEKVKNIQEFQNKIKESSDTEVSSSPSP